VSSPDIAQRAAELRADRVPFVHATVVFAARPTSAKPGAEAVVYADGTIEGFVGGTCAESTVRAQSLALLDSGEPLLLRITPTEETDSTAAVAATESGVVDNRLTVHNPCLSGGTLEIFLEPVVPAPLFVIHGDSPIATALTGLAERIGYHVADGSSEELSGAAAVVVASHGRDEEEALVAALAAGAPYVGLVASPKRGEGVVAALDVDEADKARVHTPAGLDIGAHTPEEVALSILAEVVAERRRPSGQPLGAHDHDAHVAHAGHDGHETGHAGHETIHVPHVEGAAATAPGTALDPVCGMTVATVDASLHLDHEGLRYWFCGSGCLRAFAADPSAYLTS
jgi:xanthine dehydrogenase accessory factor